MSTFKKLASDTALYGISTILGRSINFALAPIQTYAFKEPSDLSSNVTLYAWIGVLMAVYTLGLETAFFRFAARMKGDVQAEEERLTIFNRATSLVMIASVLPTVLIVLFPAAVAQWLGYPGQERLIVWSALLLAIDAIVAIPFARLRVENKAKRFVLAKVVNILINLGLNVFFIVLCKDISEGDYLPALQPLASWIYRPDIGAGYILLANLLANALYFLILRDAFTGFRFTFNWSVVKPLLIYSFPIMLTGLSGVLNTLTDRLLLRRLLPEGFYADISSEQALSIYGNCFKLSVFMALAVNSFKFAADPFFFSRAEDKNSPRLLADVTKWFIIVCVLIWVGVSLNLDVIGLVLSKRYRTGLPIVPFLLLANLFLGVYYNIAFWFKLTDKTHFGTLITLIGAAVTIIGNIVLIPVMGYMGCAVAFLASSFIMMAVCYGLGERYYPVPYHLKSAVGYIVGAGLLIWGSSQFPLANLWISVPVHLALLGLFVVVILLIERNTFKPLLKRVRSQSNKPTRTNHP